MSFFKFQPQRVTIITLTALLICGSVSAQTPEEISRIEAALPAQPRVKPAKPRKLLVFTLATGFKHASIPHGARTLELMGKKTGAFEAVVTEDIQAFAAENLKQFDGVVFLNTTGEFFTDEALKTSFQDFVKSGKGLIGIHAGSDCCFEWAEFGEAMGGYFAGHPWNADSTVTLQIEEPKHPVAAAFGGKDFTVVDEIYQFKEPYSRETLRVLTSLNPKKTDMNKKGKIRADDDYPVTWVKPHGKGRVFYCSLGHNIHIYWDKVVLQHYLDGIQYALGDLKAENSPVPGKAAGFFDKSAKKIVADAGAYEYGSPRDAENVLDAFVRSNAQKPEARKKIAKRMSTYIAAHVADSSPTLAGLQWLSRRLADIGGPENIPDLAPLLTSRDVRVADLARYAVERIPGEEAAAALRNALSRTKGERRIGIIGSIGARRDNGAVGALIKVVTSSQKEAGRKLEVIDSLGAKAEAAEAAATARLAQRQELAAAQAALRALGQIGSVESAEALQKLHLTADELRPAAADAILANADALAADGKKEAAVTIYRLLNSAKSNKEMLPLARVAAFVGLARNTGAEGRALAVEKLLGNDETLSSAAAWLVYEMPEKDVTDALAAALANKESDRRIVLLQILADRGDISALPAVRAVAEKESGVLQVAALKAVGALGGADVVEMLAGIAGEHKGPEREAARESLAVLKSREVNAALQNLLEKSLTSQKPAVAQETIRALGARRAVGSLPQLLDAAQRGDESVKDEAFGALANLAGPDEVQKIAPLLVNIDSDKVRKQAERALIAAAKRITDESTRADAVIETMESAGTTESKVSFVRVMGEIGNGKALEKLREVRKDSGDEALVDAAVKAISDFPTTAALQDALDIARNSGVETHQVLGVRGFARLLAQSQELNSSETVTYAREALDLAKRAEDKKTVLGELASLKESEVLGMIAPLIDDPELKSEAIAAAVKIAEQTYSAAPDETQEVLQKVMAADPDDTQKKSARQTLDKISETGSSVVQWSWSGPYVPKQKSVQAILKQAFPPERIRGKAVEWKVVKAAKQGDHFGLVDLDRLIGGKQRAAYLRVRVWSPQDEKARLDIGSDDGAKVWLNGRVVFEKAVTRPHKFGEDQIEIDLKQGWNYVMMKVAQAEGDWSASAKIVKPTGDKIIGLKFDTEEIEDTTLFIEGGAKAA